MLAGSLEQDFLVQVVTLRVTCTDVGSFSDQDVETHHARIAHVENATRPRSSHGLSLLNVSD